MKDVYLISLQGQGDTDIAFCDKETFAWINMERDVPNHVLDRYKVVMEQQREMYPATSETEEADLNFTEGSSPDNDRALHFIVCAEEVFHSVKDAIEHAKKNDLTIVEEYEGYIY